MKKQKLIIIILLLISIITISKTYATVNGYNLLGKVIYIDPGHGGFDPGGGSNEFFKEKDINLLISKYQNARFKEII